MVSDPKSSSSSVAAPISGPLVSDVCKDSLPLSSDLTDPNAFASARVISKAIPLSVNLESTSPMSVPAKYDPSAKAAEAVDPESVLNCKQHNNASWAGLFKGPSRRLEKKGTAFTLSSGEACVKIPNSVIEKNRKQWDCFILGQFYSEPPAQGTIHAIANGIWSRYHRDISVSKMEGFAFLFRIPNAATRNRVLNQGLWQFEGQTMFVAKWEPGLIPQKPELTSAPVWLELRQVPHQFFNEDGFEFIAGLVGHPIGLHPSTKNLSNLEVAKVLTLIDPRKPLPEAVNVQFDSGEISRVLVSSPWMPPVCSFCKEVGHSLKKCKTAPVTCSSCQSTCHLTESCPRALEKRKKTVPRRRPNQSAEGTSHSDVVSSGILPRATILSKGKAKVFDAMGDSLVEASVSAMPTQAQPIIQEGAASDWIQVKPKSSKNRVEAAGASTPAPGNALLSVDIGLDVIQSKQLETQHYQSTEGSLSSDSSDVQSLEDDVDPEIDEARFLKMFSQRQQRNTRGKGPKSC